MDNYKPTPVGKDTVVAIAVTKGRTSQAALKWTVENLLVEGHSLSVVHVRPPAPVFHQNKNMVRQTNLIEAYSGTEMRKGMQEGYKDILCTRVQEMLMPFQSYCKQKNIKSELVILEDNDLAGAIADFVLTKNVDVLVLGAESHNGLLKKLKGPDVATRIVKKAPYFCTVYVIAKGRLQYVRSASSTAQAFSDNEADILELEKSIHEPALCGQLAYSGSSVSFKELDLAKEFEFRSPLQNYGDSDFSFGGLSASDSDISFVGSDRQFYDNDSDWSLGSFSSSCASSNSLRLGLSSSAPSNSDSGCHRMDESLRLRLELIKIKSMHDSVCNDGSDAKMLTCHVNSLTPEEDER